MTMGVYPEPNPEQSVEASFRSSLRDVVTVVKKLAPHCRSVDELVGMAESALQNDGVLHLIMDQISPLGLRR